MPDTRPLCRFYLVRHGQTEWNVAHKIQGQQDSPLTKTGEEQAAQTAQKLAQVKFDRVFSSDLLRAQRTAEIIAADRELAILTSELLRESRFGPYEGLTINEFQTELREAIAERDALADEQQMVFKLHPEVESYDEVATRMLTFLREVAVAYPGENILVVSHAGIIRATLVKMGVGTNAELNHGSIKNSSYAVIDSDGVDFFLRETSGIDKERD